MPIVNRLSISLSYTFQVGQGTMTIQAGCEASLTADESLVWDGIQSNLLDDQKDVIARKVADIKEAAKSQKPQAPQQVPAQRSAQPSRSSQSDPSKPASVKQRDLLAKHGIHNTEHLTSQQASQMIKEILVNKGASGR